MPLLAQIPLVQSIREHGDAGRPVAVDDDTISGIAFRALAEKVVERVDYRNTNAAPTQKVKIVK